MNVWSPTYSVRKLLFSEIPGVSDVNRINAGGLAFQIVGIDGEKDTGSSIKKYPR